MSADKDEFLFLISTPLSQASKEQHEQQHLQARAHAARKSHAKRRSDGLTHKWVRWEAKAASQQPVSPYLGVALASSTVAAVVEPSSPPIPVPQSWSQSSLDNGNDEPFSTLAVHPLPPYVFSLLYAGEWVLNADARNSISISRLLTRCLHDSFQSEVVKGETIPE